MFCSLGLLSNGSWLTKTNFVFGLSRSTADYSRIFSEPFSKNETDLSFFFLLDYASRTCSMLRQYFFKTQSEKPCDDDVNRASLL